MLCYISSPFLNIRRRNRFVDTIDRIRSDQMKAWDEQDTIKPAHIIDQCISLYRPKQLIDDTKLKLFAKKYLIKGSPS